VNPGWTDVRPPRVSRQGSTDAGRSTVAKRKIAALLAASWSASCTAFHVMLESPPENALRGRRAYARAVSCRRDENHDRVLAQIPLVSQRDNGASRSSRRTSPEAPAGPANPRTTPSEKPRERRESAPVPAQPGGAETGLSRRRSRVRVPSLPCLSVSPTEGRAGSFGPTTRRRSSTRSSRPLAIRRNAGRVADALRQTAADTAGRRSSLASRPCTRSYSPPLPGSRLRGARA
jgi:hypothetical protein